MQHFLWLDNNRTAQSRFVPDYFNKILKQFDQIIEIGTFTGIFTKWLSLNSRQDVKIISYDINPESREVNTLPKTLFRIADCLSPDTIFEIKTLIEFGGKTLLLCDGGDKETEFKLYSRFLKEGDVIMLHDFEETKEEYESIKNKIGWTTISESHYDNLKYYLPGLKLEPFLYEDFKQVLWGSFIKKTKPRVFLTLTTCKRYDLFEKTIKTLVANLKDKNLISGILHFDDSSSEEDRFKMNSLLESNFPGLTIQTMFFEKESIPHNSRHSFIMNSWLEQLKSNDVDYALHVEDDWEFIKNFNLTDCIDFLRLNQKVGYVGFSQPLRKFPEEYEVEISGDFWKWVYFPERPINEPLFLDQVEIDHIGVEGYWCKYINWPHFGLRPAIFDVKKLSTIGKFVEESGFELEFSLRFTHYFVGFLHKERICFHTGDISSYKLNESDR